MGKFKRGDVVKLKSGGPKMTILGVNQDKAAALYNKPNPEGYYDCGWFEKDNEPDQFIHRDILHEEHLDLVD